MSLFSKLSEISRKRKTELFYEIIKPNKDMSVLDIGAQVSGSASDNPNFIDQYKWKDKVTALNIMDKHIALIKEKYPQVNVVVGDACSLPWPDKHFDIVYSNAVVEHLPNYEMQTKMASEIMRVGKSWFITTPNRWYPFEFHMRLPFVTWIPFDWYRHFSRIVRYNHIKNKYTWFNNSSADLSLLSSSRLKKCFKGSKIIKLQITFMAETLIVIKK
jgi:ubiquinone/menaquinone biosynthesis C-methylase UbiE